MQWFCKLDRLGAVRIPGKSAPQRHSQWLLEAEMRKVIDTLPAAASDGNTEGEQPLELASALDLEAYFPDTTRVKPRIHFPVDWALLRDAARTLMKAAIPIRKRSLKARMEEPAILDLLESTLHNRETHREKRLKRDKLQVR